ncbi:MAG: outer membrane beta-barrel protein [Cyclobacteriaceae bacterium]|jgi:hypothetical protein
MRFTSKNNRLAYWILVVASWLPATMHAQCCYFGVRAGASFTAEPPPGESSWGIGGELKGSITYDINDHVWAMAEVGYGVRGQKATIDSMWSSQTRNGFIETSLLLGRTFTIRKHKDHSVSWYLAAGPRLGLWTGGKSKWQNSTEAFTLRTKFSSMEESVPDPNYVYISDPNRWQAGVDVAFGVTAPWRPLRYFQVEARYTYGLTALGESAQTTLTNSIQPLDDPLQTLTISIAYRISDHIKEEKKGNSTKGRPKTKKPRKNFDSMIR